MRKLLLMAFSMLFFFSCTEEVVLPELIQGTDGLTSLIDLQVIAPTDEHQKGGVMLLVGLDEDRDGTLSSSEVQFQFPIWHGNDGVDAVAPTVSIGLDGYWYINGENTGVLAEGQNGSDGQNGVDGTQVTISEDGYWVLDGVKTDVKAEGQDGADGLTLTPIFVDRPIDPTADHTNGGILVTVYVDENQDEFLGSDEIVGIYTVWHGNDGTDGLTPYIDEETGTWWIGEFNTGVKAEGKDGKDGKDAIAPVVTIGQDGFWYIDGDNTGVKAVGVNGQDGADGHTPLVEIIDIDGTLYWFIDGVNTSVTAEGKDGLDGEDGKDGDAGTVVTLVETSQGSGIYEWYIDGSPTGVIASGTVGPQGLPGNDGSTPVITIDNCLWVIDGVPTTVNACGIKGDDGLTPEIKVVNGVAYWFIDGQNTNVPATGADGQDGSVLNYVVQTASQQDCPTGGYTIIFTVDGVQGQSFTVCNGLQGLPGLDGVDGVCDCEEEGECDECFDCTSPVFFNYNVNFGKKGHGNDRDDLTSEGWTIYGFQSADNFGVLYSASDAVFGGDPNGNRNSMIQSLALEACELEQVSVWAKTLDANNIKNVNSFPDHDADWRYRLVIMYCDGSEEVVAMPDNDSNDWTNGSGPNDTNWKKLTWSGQWFNVSNVRIEVQRKDAQGTHRTAVNKMEIKFHSNKNPNITSNGNN